MGTVKFKSKDDSNDAPLYDALLKTSAENKTASRKRAYEELRKLGVDEKDARAVTLYYVVA